MLNFAKSNIQAIWQCQNIGYIGFSSQFQKPIFKTELSIPAIIAI